MEQRAADQRGRISHLASIFFFLFKCMYDSMGTRGKNVPWLVFGCDVIDLVTIEHTTNFTALTELLHFL